MDIVRDDSSVLIRKSLAVLSLPTITRNGKVRSADLALGDSLILFIVTESNVL